MSESSIAIIISTISATFTLAMVLNALYQTWMKKQELAGIRDLGCHRLGVLLKASLIENRCVNNHPVISHRIAPDVLSIIKGVNIDVCLARIDDCLSSFVAQAGVPDVDLGVTAVIIKPALTTDDHPELVKRGPVKVGLFSHNEVTLLEVLFPAQGILLKLFSDVTLKRLIGSRPLSRDLPSTNKSCMIHFISDVKRLQLLSNDQVLFHDLRNMIGKSITFLGVPRWKAQHPFQVFSESSDGWCSIVEEKKNADATRVTLDGEVTIIGYFSNGDNAYMLSTTADSQSEDLHSRITIVRADTRLKTDWRILSTRKQRPTFEPIGDKVWRGSYWRAVERNCLMELSGKTLEYISDVMPTYKMVLTRSLSDNLCSVGFSRRILDPVPSMLETLNKFSSLHEMSGKRPQVDHGLTPENRSNDCSFQTEVKRETIDEHIKDIEMDVRGQPRLSDPVWTRAKGGPTILTGRSNVTKRCEVSMRDQSKYKHHTQHPSILKTYMMHLLMLALDNPMNDVHSLIQTQILEPIEGSHMLRKWLELSD